MIGALTGVIVNEDGLAMVYGRQYLRCRNMLCFVLKRVSEDKVEDAGVRVLARSRPTVSHAATRLGHRERPIPTRISTNSRSGIELSKVKYPVRRERVGKGQQYCDWCFDEYDELQYIYFVAAMSPEIRRYNLGRQPWPAGTSRLVP